MARALIVGCGHRGRGLGRSLAAAGWAVRGTSRGAGLEAIAAAGIEAVEADPDRIGTLLDAIEGVTVVAWLMGAPDGGARVAGELNGARFGRLLEEIVDTPVRGVAYERRGAAGELAAEAAADAERRWRVPCEPITASPEDHDAWLDGARAAVFAALG